MTTAATPLPVLRPYSGPLVHAAQDRGVCGDRDGWEGRWAKQRGLARTEGHKAGEASLLDVIRVGSRSGAVANHELEFACPSCDLVDESWDEDEWHALWFYLSSGTTAGAYVGCLRVACAASRTARLSTQDGTYQWPEGLAHYVAEHAVRLPSELVEHAMRQLDPLEAEHVSLDWWLAGEPRGAPKSHSHAGSALSRVAGDPGASPRQVRAIAKGSLSSEASDWPS
jgi:hypothetical protein